MTPCRICLEDTHGDDYHPACLDTLFGVGTCPVLDVELHELYSLAASRMAGKMSISGAQPKVSLVLSPDATSLDVAADGGRYILKPETSQFASLPQNEQLSMRMARLVSVEVPPSGLVRLEDGTTAYVIKRFDRLEDGTKLAMEDFCQLAEKRIRDKYNGSAELCVRILRKYATEPLVEIQKLFRLTLFSWWMANGDMHLKNFSLITTTDGIHRLSPAYDLLCTKLVIPDDTLALPIGGRRDRLSRRHWLEFAEYCRIPARAANRVIDEQVRSFEPAQRLVAASFLPERMKERYVALLRENTATLVG